MIYHVCDDNEYITTKREKQYGTTLYFSKANNFFHAIHCDSSCKSTTHNYHLPLQNIHENSNLQTKMWFSYGKQWQRPRKIRHAYCHV